MFLWKLNFRFIKPNKAAICCWVLFCLFGWFGLVLTFQDKVFLYSLGCAGICFIDQPGLELRDIQASISGGLGLKIHQWED